MILRPCASLLLCLSLTLPGLAGKNKNEVAPFPMEINSMRDVSQALTHIHEQNERAVRWHYYAIAAGALFFVVPLLYKHFSQENCAKQFNGQCSTSTTSTFLGW